MTVQIADGVQWISQCVSEDEKHMHVSQYLLRGDDDEHVLIDTGSSFRREETIGAIKDSLDGGRISVVLLTHSTLPHTENLKLINEEWDDLEIIAATNNPTVTGLKNYAEDTQPKILNEARDFAGRRFSFLDPVLTDVVSSNWIYDHETGTLFTAEGLGHYHDPEECGSTSRDMSDGIPFENIHAFQRDKLPYLKIVDPRKLREGFEALFDTIDVQYIAPIHGNVVESEDIEQYLDRTVRSARRISEDWSAPQLTGD